MISQLTEYRVKNGMSQEKLAESLGLARITVAKWECGMHKPSKLAIKWVMDKIGIDITE